MTPVAMPNQPLCRPTSRSVGLISICGIIRTDDALVI